MGQECPVIERIDENAVPPTEYDLQDSDGNQTGARIKLSAYVVNLRPWEQHGISETTVTADSYAHLYRLDLESFRDAVNFLRKMKMDTSARLPCAASLALPAAIASSITSTGTTFNADPVPVAGGQHKIRAINFGWRELPEGARQADLIHTSRDYAGEAAPQAHIGRGDTECEETSIWCDITFEDVMTEILRCSREGSLRQSQPSPCFKCSRWKVSPAP